MKKQNHSWEKIFSQLGGYHFSTDFFIFGNFCKNIRHKYTFILIILVVKLQNLSNSRTSLKPNCKRLKAYLSHRNTQDYKILKKITNQSPLLFAQSHS